MSLLLVACQYYRKFPTESPPDKVLLGASGLMWSDLRAKGAEDCERANATGLRPLLVAGVRVREV